MSDVERFEPYTDEGNREGYGQMEPCETGDWVRFADYRELERAQAPAAPQVSVMDDTAPTLWGDMTDAQKGALLLAIHEGKVIEVRGDATSGEWKAMTNGVYLLDHCAYRARALTTEGKDNE